MCEDKSLIEKQVCDLLTAFMSGESTGPEKSKLEILRELDRITLEQKSVLAPQLVHFMQRRSYQKALIWLMADEAQRKDLDHG